MKKFKKELKSKFNLKSECIYNPLNKKEINKSSKKKLKLIFLIKKVLKLLVLQDFQIRKIIYVL